jgi:hypothetical protein
MKLVHEERLHQYVFWICMFYTLSQCLEIRWRKVSFKIVIRRVYT